MNDKPDLIERLWKPCEVDQHYGELICGLRVLAIEEIKILRAENEKLNGVIQSYQITLETQQGEILRLRAELAQADEMLKRQAMTIKSLQAALEDDDGLTTAYLVGLHTGRDERKVSSQVILDNSNDEVG